MGTAYRIAWLYEATLDALLDRAADPREAARPGDLLAEVHRGTTQVAGMRERAARRVAELEHAELAAERAGAAALREQLGVLLPREQELVAAERRLRARAAASGHRIVPHAADLRIEAWGPTREDCLAEAVRGLVDSFAAVRGLQPRGRLRRHLTAASDEDLLAAVLDEVIYLLDAEAEITGALPKGVSLRDMRCTQDAAGRWSGAVIVDV